MREGEWAGTARSLMQQKHKGSGQRWGEGEERPGCERDAEGKGRWGEGGERPGCERDAEGKGRWEPGGAAAVRTSSPRLWRPGQRSGVRPTFPPDSAFPCNWRAGFPPAP